MKIRLAFLFFLVNAIAAVGDGFTSDILVYTGSPEGKVYAPIGWMIADGNLGKLYIKASDRKLKTGWRMVVGVPATPSGEVPIENYQPPILEATREIKGSPEGIQTGRIGRLIKDVDAGDLYIKSTPSSVRTGWRKIVTTMALTNSGPVEPMTPGVLDRAVVLRWNPEGIENGRIGRIAVHGDKGELYVKTTQWSSKTGWIVATTVEATGGPIPPDITGTNVVTGNEIVPFSYTPTLLSGTSTPEFPLVYSLLHAPDWLHINSETGVVSGVPPIEASENNPHTFTIVADNGIGSDSLNVSVNIVAPTTALIFYGNFPEPIPSQFTPQNIVSLDNGVPSSPSLGGIASLTRAGLYQFGAGTYPRQHQVFAWPSSLSGGQHFTASSLDVPFIGGQATPYNTVVINGIDYHVFVTFNPNNGGFNNVGGNPIQVY